MNTLKHEDTAYLIQASYLIYLIYKIYLCCKPSYSLIFVTVGIFWSMLWQLCVIEKIKQYNQVNICVKVNWRYLDIFLTFFTLVDMWEPRNHWLEATYPLKTSLWLYQWAMKHKMVFAYNINLNSKVFYSNCFIFYVIF